MKLGVFDSGLGGLLIAKSIREKLPDIDILYFGDTLHLPYGNRSDEAITMYTKRAMDAMFQQGCSLIVMACNTASAACLRKLQQEYLPEAWPGRNIIGVVVPTLEEAIERGHTKLGLIATNYLVRSKIYEEELRKINPGIQLSQTATPLLVPLIENGGAQWIKSVLMHYLTEHMPHDIECLILGCTHYGLLKDHVRVILGQNVDLITQDDLIPGKLAAYLQAHPEYEVGRSGRDEFFVSDLTDNYVASAQELYGAPIEIGVLNT
jgi:glutamate racemase